MSESGYSVFGMVIQPPDDEVVPNIPREVRRLHTPVADVDVTHKEKAPVKLDLLLPTPIVRNDVGPGAYVPPRQLDVNAESGIALQKDSIEDTFSDMVHNDLFERSVPLVVLDCANIGWCYGMDSFSAAGVSIALQYFQQLQIEIQAFLPASYLRAKPGPADSSRGNAMMVTEDLEILQELAGTALLTIVPSGDSDDAYILNYARDNNGFVISNDLFHDHLRGLNNDSIRSSMYVWLQEHRCGYAFSARREFLFNPSSRLREAVQMHADHTRSLELEQQQQRLEAELTDLTLSLNTGDSNAVGDDLDPHAPLPLPPVPLQQSNYTQIVSMIESVSALINTAVCMTATTHSSGSAKDSGGFSSELKWLLLTRASLLRKAGLVDGARQDLEYVLSHIDAQCAEAHHQLTLL